MPTGAGSHVKVTLTRITEASTFTGGPLGAASNYNWNKEPIEDYIVSKALTFILCSERIKF